VERWGVAPQCYGCARLWPLEPGSGWRCDAFDAIPKAIMTNFVSHRVPYPGDGGMSFLPIEPDIRADSATVPMKAAGIMFVSRDDKILLLRRSSAGDHAGEWNLPGGKLEDGESALDAAAREAEEETGREVDPTTLSEWTRQVRDGVDYIVFLCRVDEPFQVKIDGESDGYVWIERKSLNRADAEWHEVDHPRGAEGTSKGGQFVGKGEGGGGTRETRRSRPSPSEGETERKFTALERKTRIAAKPSMEALAKTGAQVKVMRDKFYDENRQAAKLPEWNEFHSAVCQKISDTMGYTGSRGYVVTSKEHKTFDLNGKKYETAGEAYLDTGEVRLYLDSLTPNSIGPVLAHEIMHQKWEQVFRRYQAESKTLRDMGPEADKILYPDDRVRPGHEDEFPIYARLNSLMDTRVLRDEDGVTDYSRDWWAAVESGKADPKSAVHETMAEMAMLNLEGSLERLLWFKESKSYRLLYEAVLALYDPKWQPQKP
jgi:8-oxo-dGTP pyrophosphatase MutT (NUDIX family)